VELQISGIQAFTSYYVLHSEYLMFVLDKLLSFACVSIGLICTSSYKAIIPNLEQSKVSAVINQAEETKTIISSGGAS